MCCCLLQKRNVAGMDRGWRICERFYAWCNLDELKFDVCYRGRAPALSRATTCEVEPVLGGSDAAAGAAKTCYIKATHLVSLWVGYVGLCDLKVLLIGPYQALTLLVLRSSWAKIREQLICALLLLSEAKALQTANNSSIMCATPVL